MNFQSHNIIIVIMYLGDVCELQTHLNNDWTVILKDVKAMEDYHYDLLQYNKRVVSKQRIQDGDLFINDQILQHHKEIDRMAGALQTIHQELQEIRVKYEGAIVSFEEILKLMGRVGARILETYQYSIDKCKSLDQNLIDKHLKVKSTLIKLMNQKDKINLEEIINIVYNFSKNKLNAEIEKLRKIVLSLENGDYQKTQGTYQFKNRKQSISPQKVQKASPSISPQKKNISVQKSKISSVGREQRSPVWQQLKAQEKIRKQKQKVALRLVHGLYSTMQLARQQIIQDMCSNQRDKTKRLYNEIFSRNKFNYDQIMKFQSKKEEFHEKVKMFKEMMERESKKLAEAIRKSSVKRQKRKVQNLNFSHIQIDHSEDEKPQQKELGESRKSANRYRIQSPKTKNVVISQQNFTHVQFDSSTQSTYIKPNKNKLPFLYNQNISQYMQRAASFDQRAELNKVKSHMNAEKQQILNQQSMLRQKIKKQQKYLIQRAKVPLKNIEVRVDGVMRQDQGQGKQRNKPNPMQYTFYVRRNNRFYQPNHNIIS